MSKKRSNKDCKNFAIEPIHISFGKLVVLENARLTIENGKHYALIGKNGIGKTSLLNAIANRNVPLPVNLNIIYVKQEELATDQTVLNTILSSDNELYLKNKDWKNSKN